MRKPQVLLGNFFESFNFLDDVHEQFTLLRVHDREADSTFGVCPLTLGCVHVSFHLEPGKSDGAQRGIFAGVVVG